MGFDFEKDFIAACPPDPVDNRDVMLADYVRPTRTPSRVDWFEKAYTMIKDQGNTPSCVGQASSLLKEIQERYEHKQSLGFDGFKLYEECKKIDGYDGDGTYIRTSMKVLEIQGINPMPTRSLLADKTFKIKAYTSLKSVEDMQYALASTGPIVIGVSVYENFSRVNRGNGWTVPMPSGANRGGHAVLVAGYDKNDKKFYFINSWGKEWGYNGRANFSFDFIEQAMHTAWAGFDLDDQFTQSIIKTEELKEAVEDAKGGD